ncbi:MAG: acyltransferase family protein [Candidatus Latescibacterota bacterium]|nr:acyltransferase family protein [Candidatus Latescibacterota bacterium]
MASAVRRHDVDWARSYALLLLIFYHVLCSFQPWAHKLAIPQNAELLEGPFKGAWVLNIWRIPFLFLVSGMSLRLAMNHRGIGELLRGRSVRILFPLLFGWAVVWPFTMYWSQGHFGRDMAYMPGPGHLWFLQNIYLYTMMYLGLARLIGERWRTSVDRINLVVRQRPYGLYLSVIPLMAEAWIVNPGIFSFYVDPRHGYPLGFVCFSLGYLFAWLGVDFWNAVRKLRHGTTAVVVGVFSLTGVGIVPPTNPFIAFLSTLCMLALLGHGAHRLNRPSPLLSYLTGAVFPVYIVHFPLQFVGAFFILRLELPVVVKFLFLLASTLVTSFALYEVLLRRLGWGRLLFGMPRFDRVGRFLPITA